MKREKKSAQAILTFYLPRYQHETQHLALAIFEADPGFVGSKVIQQQK